MTCRIVVFTGAEIRYKIRRVRRQTILAFCPISLVATPEAIHSLTDGPFSKMQDSLENAARELTIREKNALLALGKISAGQQAFLNVIDADILVKKGLAERFGKSQFMLTDRGRALIGILQRESPRSKTDS